MFCQAFDGAKTLEGNWKPKFAKQSWRGHLVLWHSVASHGGQVPAALTYWLLVREGMTSVKVLPILVVLVGCFLRRFLKEKLPGSFVPQTSPHCGDPLTALADAGWQVLVAAQAQ